MRTLTGQSVPNIDPPDSEYPYGRARNSSPPESRNGTPLLETNLMTDCGYAMLAVMKEAGVIPDESAENIDVSQFKAALLSLIGTVPNPDKVIIDAPILESGSLNLLNRMSGLLNINEFNAWVGVSEAVGKLTISGIVLLKVRNYTGGPVVATAETSVYAGSPGNPSAGFIQVDNNDNTDLQKPENVIGELAEDFNFTDTTTFFPVLVVLKGKPMFDSNWIQNLTDKFLTPAQPGIQIETLSSEWDESFLEDMPRISFSPHFIVFDNPLSGRKIELYLNAAINDIAQLVSTSGEKAVTVTIDENGTFIIRFYDPAGGAGSLLSLTKQWIFSEIGRLETTGSIILSSSDTTKENGEVWYDTLIGKLIGKQAGSEFNLIGAEMEQGCMYVKDNATVTVISATGVANKVKFTGFATLGPATPVIGVDIGSQDATLEENGVYEILCSITLDSVVGPATSFGLGIYSASGAVAHDMLHQHRNVNGGGGEEGSVTLSGQDFFSASDKIELYVYNMTNTQNVLLLDVTLSIKKIRSL